MKDRRKKKKISKRILKRKEMKIEIKRDRKLKFFNIYN